jgi:hypothetical protein
LATITPKTLVEGVALGTSASTLYTVPASTTATFRSITICNTDTNIRKVTVYIVASGGSAGVLNTIYDALVLEPGQTYTDDTIRTMMAGDFIQAFADSANLVSLRVDGAEIT